MKKVFLFVVRFLGVIIGIVFGFSGIFSSIFSFFGLASMSSLSLPQQISRFVYYLLFTIALVIPYRRILKKFRSFTVLIPIIILTLYTAIRSLITIITDSDYNLISAEGLIANFILLMIVGNLAGAIIIYKDIKGK